MLLNKPSITFVLPGTKNCGGVINTIIMGNILIDRGYSVRIIYRKLKLKRKLKDFFKFVTTFKTENEIKSFKGKLHEYHDINSLHFNNNEIVVAQGAYTVKDVFNICCKNIIKVRHCRGFSSYNSKLMKEAWGIPMHTISVSSTLVPLLEKYSGCKVIGIVPNGKDFTKFYDENLKRDGIGVLLYNHPNKCYHDIHAVLKELQKKLPEHPLYAFGTIPKPKRLPFLKYYRLPDIEKIRYLYNKSLVWFSTSKDEGLPNPLLEAMCCGAAIVSTDNLGSRELINNSENGFLVPIGDVKGLVDRIKYLIQNDTVREKFVATGKNISKYYTWENAADQMEKVIKQLCK